LCRWQILLFFIIGVQCVFGQHTPPVLNFKASEYKAHQQNWAMDQASDRIMYMANSEGLLTYNGNSWSLHKTPNQKIIRSIRIVNDRIYTGSYGEIGYWTNEDCNDLKYHSLTNLVPENAISKEEIWHILHINDKIYFQSFSVLLVYDGKNIERIRLPGSIMFLYPVGDKLIFQALEHGLFELKPDNSLAILPETDFFNGKTVTGMLPYDDQKIMITTNTDGIFIYDKDRITIWNAPLKSYLSEIQINKVHGTEDGIIFLGSIRDGLLGFTKEGKLLYQVNTSNGLQNNSVLSMIEDVDGNIWLGLDKGIAMIDVHNELKVYYDVKGQLGTVYTAATYDSTLYLGTNQGVYFSELKQIKGANINRTFKLVKGTQGQVWQLKATKHGLVCGHNEGTFIINKDKAKKISSVTGGWYMEYLPYCDNKLLLQGTYTGLVLFTLDNNVDLSHKLNNFNEPVKKFIFDKYQNIWAVGPFTGLFKLTPDSDFKKIIKTKKYGLAEGISTDNGLDLNMIQNKIAVAVDGKHFIYDEKVDKFIENNDLNQNIDKFLLRSPDDLHLFKIYNDSFVLWNGISTKSFNYQINKDYHSIVNLHDGKNVLFCLDEGYAISSYETLKSQKAKVSDIIFDKIIGKDFCFDVQKTKSIEIPYEDRNFKVYFHHTDYKSTKNYTYKLNGNRNDDTWLPINDPSFISLSSLPQGDHFLTIQSSDGSISDSLKFKISPPWYQSKLAIFIYICFIIVLFYLLKEYVNKTIKNEKLKLEIENERLLREHKYQLENDRLVQDNLTKSKELANATMHLIQKNELLQEIKEELIDVRKTGDHTLTAKDFQNLMKLINENMTVEDDKNLFESSFNDVHEPFIKNLKKQFPDLTAADLKLAAYLKMNLSSKEIAPLFNISIRGLENKRYRLRKKLNLPNDANLNEFFMAYMS
jgi:Two component regulator propeller